MSDDVLRFTAFDDMGNRLDCEALFTFESVETGRSYIVYTDHSLDDDGNTKVYASIFDPADLESAADGEMVIASLTPIETEAEWQLVETILEDLQQEVSEALGDEDFFPWDD